MLLADAAQLPAVLRDPPWRHGTRVASMAPCLSLPPSALPARLVWSADERERIRQSLVRPVSGYSTDETRATWNQYALDALGVRVESRALLMAGAQPQPGDLSEPPGEPMLYALDNLPDALALTLWQTIPASRWHSIGADDNITRLLLRFDVAAVPPALKYAAQRPVQGLRIMRWIDAPELAAIALNARRRLKFARQVASDWLLAHPATTADVLVRQLFGSDDHAREDARAALHALAAAGLRAPLEDAAKALGGEVPRALADQLDADPLLRLPERMPPLPKFFDPTKLHRPRLRVDGAGLPDDAMRNLGLMLAISKPDEPYAGIDQVREACTDASLAAFACDVFQAWVDADMPSAGAWAFHALALINDDSTAHRLGARALIWARDKKKQRAYDALEMLAGFGSDAALMQISNLAARAKPDAVRARAAGYLDTVAEQRDLSRDELADRIVPTLGLDEDRTLDFGARRFTIRLDETLKPYVIVEGGARLKELPKPRRDDDAALAGAAELRWKQLKKDLRTMASAQIARLERAMVDQRRWTSDEFHRFFVAHPVLRELAARLLWGVFDARGGVVDALRIAEDGTLADAQDHPCSLPADARVGIVHPLVLPPALAQAFGVVFADYEILQPLAQLDREVHALGADDAAGSSLERFVGRDVATGAVIGMLDRGWSRGTTEDGGMINTIDRALGDGLTALLRLSPGMYVGQLSAEPRQELGKLVVVDPQNKPAAFGRADPVLLSEVLRDIHRLTPRG